MKPENEGLEAANDMDVDEEDDVVQIDDVKEVKSSMNEAQTEKEDKATGDGDGEAQTNDPKMMVNF